MNETNLKEFDIAISRSTANYNRDLKIIASPGRYTKNISSHTARHRFATKALRLGMSLDKVQFVLSHQNPAITKVYAKLINEEVDKAMLCFNL